jgi:hypothetical protein
VLSLLAPTLLLATCLRAAPAAAWPEADRLFHQSPQWLGGDGAYSVDLGSGRVLWIFGDSFIAPADSARREGAAIVRNSIAVERGYDPETATMTFHWGGSRDKPSAFFEDGRQGWLWPAHGARVGSKLILFFMKVRESRQSGLGFELFGRAAFAIDDPDAEPAAWRPRRLALPKELPKLLFGSAVLVRDGWLYAYCPEEPSHDVYLARWPSDLAERGKLSRPQWWCGQGWQEGRQARPAALFNAGTEFSVHFDEASRRYLQVQTTGFGAADLSLRRAEHPEGPWSEPSRLFRPEESDRPRVMVYAGKAHPELRGGGLVVSYAANSFDFGTLVRDLSLYFPRFVRVAPEPAAP